MHEDLAIVNTNPTLMEENCCGHLGPIIHSSLLIS